MAIGAELPRSAWRLPQMASGSPYRSAVLRVRRSQTYAASTFRPAPQAHGVSRRPRSGCCRAASPGAKPPCLSAFRACPDGEGEHPEAGLVQATNGDFYGTTAFWRSPPPWDGLQNHSERHADDAIQLLPPERVSGRLTPLRGAGPGRQWGPIRHNLGRRGQRPWYSLQNHAEWHADAAV